MGKTFRILYASCSKCLILIPESRELLYRSELKTGKEFAGECIPKICDVFEVSNPESRESLYRSDLKNGKYHMEWATLKFTGELYQWTIRQQEILSSARDYELTIDINSVMAKSDELTYIPNTIKKLIGLFCNPVIASGFIVFVQSD